MGNPLLLGGKGPRSLAASRFSGGVPVQGHLRLATQDLGGGNRTHRTPRGQGRLHRSDTGRGRADHPGLRGAVVVALGRRENRPRTDPQGRMGRRVRCRADPAGGDHQLLRACQAREHRGGTAAAPGRRLPAGTAAHRPEDLGHRGRPRTVHGPDRREKPVGGRPAQRGNPGPRLPEQLLPHGTGCRDRGTGNRRTTGSRAARLPDP